MEGKEIILYGSRVVELGQWVFILTHFLLVILGAKW